MTAPWTYPSERYYYGWYGNASPAERSDGDIKSEVVERLRQNWYTRDNDIKVDVKQGVVVLGGVVDSVVEKRAAGDDGWDTAGVKGVSNQLEIGPAA